MVDLSSYDKVFVLCDDNTERLCLDVFVPSLDTTPYTLITIPSGEENKSIECVGKVWNGLMEGGATRYSVLINLGGGMVTDLGGFAASTYKRGIKFMNIPTTLLGMVDASSGGKTGFNFGGMKNEIGVFSLPTRVLFDYRFLKTLDSKNFLSGYAEMLKHGLLSKYDILDELLAFDIDNPDYVALDRMIRRSVGVKKMFVEKDPGEKDMRKALNFGHTFGHALESFAMEKGEPVLHGYAVAWGMICELYLSVKYYGFPETLFHTVVTFIRENYGHMEISCDDYDRLFDFVCHDKKNYGDTIQCTLLSGQGSVRINRPVDKEQFVEALDFFRDGI